MTHLTPSWTKEKETEYQREWRLRNPEKQKEYRRRWRERNADKVQLSKTEWRKKYPERSIESGRAWRAVNKEKIRAQHVVSHAIERYGLVKPGLCQRCGEKPSAVAHHPDYNRPLDVAWLCRPCHILVHSLPEVKP